MSVLQDWWSCQARIRQLEAELKRAGVHQRDPMYPLIREMAAIPDRLFRLALSLLLGLFALALWIEGGLGDGRVTGVSVLPGTTAHSRIYIFDAPGGSRWMPCLQIPGKQCLEVFTQPLPKGKP